MNEVQQKLGYALRMERERRNLSIEEMSQQLKISETNLLAIEDGNAGALPGELYFKMFAKSYAEALGIDYERTIEAIREELGITAENGQDQPDTEHAAAATDSGTTEPRTRVESHRMPRTIPIRGGFKSYLVLILLGIVVVIMAYILFAPKGNKFGFLRFGESSTDDSYTAGQEDSTEVDAGDYRVVAGAKDKPVLTLEMTARDRTWATVIADGDTALHYNLKPWREYVIGAQEKLIVSVVSPLSVDMKLNGIPVDFSDPEKGSVQQVEVTMENMSLFIKRAQTDSAGLDTLGTSDTNVTPSDSGSDSTTTPIKQASPEVKPAPAVVKPQPRDTGTIPKGTGR